jgi:hypothetical protein
MALISVPSFVHINICNRSIGVIQIFSTPPYLHDSAKVVRQMEEFIFFNITAGPPLWSSGQSSWLQIRGPGSIPGTIREKKSSGSGTRSTQPREYN